MNAHTHMHIYTLFSLSLILTHIIIIIGTVFVYILLSYFTKKVLVISSTVAMADMWIGLCANIFTIDK